MDTGTKFVWGLTAVAAIMAPAPAYAAQPLWLGVNQSYYVGGSSPITKAVVGNPKIADIQDLGPNALNIVAMGKGTTTVNVWTANGMRQDFTVNVKEDEGSSLAYAVEQAINLPNVTVQAVGNRVLLRGTVRNQYEKDLAFKIACLYVGDDPTQTKQDILKLGNSGGGASGVKTEVTTEEQIDSSARVINLLDMENPDQINMEALVIEINSDAAKKLGVTYASEVQNNTSGTGVTLGDTGLFYGGESFGVQRDAGSHWYNRNWLFTHFSKVNAQLRLLVEQGKARVVSRPNITTMSGKSAGILVGGQIPYPSVSGSNSNVTVEYKPYGISLNIVNPTVDRQGNIVAKLNAEVSRLDWSNSVLANGYRMPGLSTRSAQTVVTIPTGMTMAIGGLLNSEDTKTISKLPVLGDIPVLGELFKYHNTSRQKSEIMVLITPRVVNEHDKVKMSEKMEETFQDSRREYQAMKEVDPNGAIPPKPGRKKKAAPLAQDAETSPLDVIIPVDGGQGN